MRIRDEVRSFLCTRRPTPYRRMSESTRFDDHRPARCTETLERSQKEAA